MKPSRKTAFLLYDSQRAPIIILPASTLRIIGCCPKRELSSALLRSLLSVWRVPIAHRQQVMSMMVIMWSRVDISGYSIELLFKRFEKAHFLLPCRLRKLLTYVIPVPTRFLLCCNINHREGKINI